MENIIVNVDMLKSEIISKFEKSLEESMKITGINAESRNALSKSEFHMGEGHALLRLLKMDFRNWVDVHNTISPIMKEINKNVGKFKAQTELWHMRKVK